MGVWAEVHWSEGMFLRPHHLQASQRWLETTVSSGFDALRPFGWGFLRLSVAAEPLENFTFRLDECIVRMKDGTWVHVPENTDVEPLDFQEAIEQADGPLEIFLGIPQIQEVRANSVSLEHPEQVTGTPRFEPHAVVRRDENTGENPQTLYVRRMRGKLFTAGDDSTGYDVVRVGSVVKSDRPGAIPELDPLLCGPVLTIQSDAGLARFVKSLADQIEAKNEVMGKEAREHRMLFTDGMPANTEHLLKLHALNETRAQFRAMLQSPLLHPYDIFVVLSRLIGQLSVFQDELVPPRLPLYDHDQPGAALYQLHGHIETMLDGLRPMAYVERRFVRKKDPRGHEGLEVELDRSWVDDDLEMYVGLHSVGMDIAELERHIYSGFNFKLASPSRAPRIGNIAVRGLRLQIKSVPAGTLPRRQDLHYFRIDKTIGSDRTDYWRECENENGIRIGIQEGQMADFEKFQPSLYVILQPRK